MDDLLLVPDDYICLTCPPNYCKRFLGQVTKNLEENNVKLDPSQKAVTT